MTILDTELSSMSEITIFLYDELSFRNSFFLENQTYVGG